MVAKIARAAWASPPSGRPGRVVLFQAIMSKCAHGTSSGTTKTPSTPANPADGFLEGDNDEFALCY